MKPENLERLNAARRRRVAAVQITDLATGADSLVIEGEPSDPHFAPVITSALRSGKTGLVEMNGRSLFLNAHLPPPEIVVIGAVHISQVLAEIAGRVGFDIRIIDPRTAFATPERFAGIDLAAEWPVDALALRPLDAYCAVVALSHDPKIDEPPLAEALRVGCFYIGALGSRKSHAARLARLRAEGFDDQTLARIHGPIGLHIGASSPAEIAVAILAEIIQVLRLRDAADAGEKP